MAIGTGNLPNPGMSFTPFDILTAAEMNDLVENIEALATGSGIGDGAIGTTGIANNAVTPAKRSGGFKVGVIPGSTLSTTGVKNITGVGFQPKMVVFRTLGADANTASTVAWGASDGTSQYFVCSYATGATNTAGRMTGTDACVAIMASPTALGLKASLTSLGSDGFSLDVTTALNFDVAYEAYS